MMLETIVGIVGIAVTFIKNLQTVEQQSYLEECCSQQVRSADGSSA